MPSQTCPSFYTAFKQNMETLGLPAPASVYAVIRRHPEVVQPGAGARRYASHARLGMGRAA